MIVKPQTCFSGLSVHPEGRPVARCRWDLLLIVLGALCLVSSSSLLRSALLLAQAVCRALPWRCSCRQALSEGQLLLPKQRLSFGLCFTKAVYLWETELGVRDAVVSKSIHIPPKRQEMYLCI